MTCGCSPRFRVSACKRRLGSIGLATVSFIEYVAKGGKLKHVKLDFRPLSPELDCGRVACPGRVRFSIVIDGEGRPRDPVVLGNTFQFRLKEHADEARNLLLEWRYAPPRIQGKPVCVKHIVEIA